jgi:hypothetical protein
MNSQRNETVIEVLLSLSFPWGRHDTGCAACVRRRIVVSRQTSGATSQDISNNRRPNSLPANRSPVAKLLKPDRFD